MTDLFILPLGCQFSAEHLHYLEPNHFSDLVAEGPSVTSEDLRFCTPFLAKFEPKKNASL